MFLPSMLKKKTIRTTFLWFFFHSVFLLSIAGQARADCSCRIGTNAISNIGTIYQANTCPDETGSYVYDEFYIQCGGGTITLWLLGQQDLYSGTPEEIIQNHAGSNDIILRNPAGTNLIIVNDLSSMFNGVIAGVTIAGKLPGVYQANPPEKLNQYCMATNLSDQDSDGFPDCLDCDPEDSNANEYCPLASIPKNLGKCID